MQFDSFYYQFMWKKTVTYGCHGNASHQPFHSKVSWSLSVYLKQTVTLLILENFAVNHFLKLISFKMCVRWFTFCRCLLLYSKRKTTLLWFHEWHLRRTFNITHEKRWVMLLLFILNNKNKPTIECTYMITSMIMKTFLNYQCTIFWQGDMLTYPTALLFIYLHFTFINVSRLPPFFNIKNKCSEY